jgi:hypothetical protein
VRINRHLSQACEVRIFSLADFELGCELPPVSVFVAGDAMFARCCCLAEFMVLPIFRRDSEEASQTMPSSVKVKTRHYLVLRSIRLRLQIISATTHEDSVYRSDSSGRPSCKIAI